ncbi:hypothetical protein FIV42_28050 [Persicimonas caeni]|uniref:Lipoprotein n=1 Tax=Persicimonas caeni TaxID=2292766 RepID=A0A4Y6Q1J0_PERCE|nr:hypothetical protein [Persicimonas caeni]QDG54458.1 hypothetical protein FIV42_28050 [Persicimonas caeni]QED35679.1 hypothetical protein FRD00_28045 [Persicimonas caeni]
MMNSRMLVVLLAGLFLTLGTACGDDSNSESNNDTNNTAADAGNNGADVQQAQLPDDWEYESDYYLRFTSFQFKQSSPGYGLNTLLRINIEKQEKKYPIVVLVHLKDIDPDGGTLAIRGGAGRKADLMCDPELDGDCEYMWDEDTPDTYTEGVALDTASGDFSAELPSLDFIATFESPDGEETDTVIPITDLRLDARFPHAYLDDNGEVVVEEAIYDADLLGYLTEANADASAVQLSDGQEPIPLSEILGKETMNADLDSDGTNDAWELTGTFSAQPATVATVAVQ